MGRRLLVASLGIALLGSRVQAQQDFLFGVHGGNTLTRHLTTSGYTTYERGHTFGLSGTMPLKPWLGVTLELLIVDKGKLTSRTPHRYFEVPYLLRLASPWQWRRIRPYVTGGAAYAYELACVSACASPERVTTDFSRVLAVGTTYTLSHFELSLEQRYTRGQNTLDRNPGNHVTSDMRSLLFRFAYRIAGAMP